VHVNRPRPIAAAALAAAVLTAGTAAAQDRQSEFDGYVIPGWSFTPGISIATVWDTNVALAGRSGDTGRTEGDNIFNIAPFGRIALESRRTQFSVGYRGYIRRHVDIESLNGFDQNAHASLRHMLSPRVTLFASNHYSDSPTTDLIELNGVPFARIGSRSNRLSGGVEGLLSKYTTLRVNYENTWTAFDSLDGFLSDGTVHGLGVDLTRRLSERLTVGVEGRLRRSDVTRLDPRVIWFQDGRGAVEYRLTEYVAVHGALGVTHLRDSRFSETRTAPYYRLGIERRTARAIAGLIFERSYTPTFGFSGSNDTKELRGFIHMPFSRNRFYVHTDGTWRRANPFFAGDLDADTFLTSSTIGYSAMRWLRIEAYHAYSRQDSIVTGGEVTRHRIGTQLVISQPMRIR
jgi:hypothetical protein